MLKAVIFPFVLLISLNCFAQGPISANFDCPVPQKKLQSFTDSKEAEKYLTEKVLTPKTHKKINKKIELYLNAQKFLVDKFQVHSGDNFIPPDGGSYVRNIKDNKTEVTRDEWEELLKLSDELNSEDKINTSSFHSCLRAIKKFQTLENSIVDLSIIRHKAGQRNLFCKNFPKGGMLHVHPAGTFDRRTVESVFEQTNPLIDRDLIEFALSLDLYEKEKNYLNYLNTFPGSVRFMDLVDRDSFVNIFVLPETGNSHNFTRFSAFFRLKGFLTHRIFSEDTSADRYDAFVAKVYSQVLQRAVRHRVKYIEFTKGISLDEMESRVTFTKRMEEKFGVTIRWNISFSRSVNRYENLEYFVKVINKLRANPELQKYFVGIDLLSDETSTPALENGQLLYTPLLGEQSLAGGLRLNRTMHAGELGDHRNVRDALILGSKRLGHGVALADLRNIYALEFARRIKTPVEINLISNLKLGVVKSIRAHPFVDFLRLGLPVSLSTDDEGLFQTNITKECEAAVGKTDISYQELKQMSYNAINTSFIDDVSKKKLIVRLDSDFKKFEQWVIDWQKYYAE